MNNILNILAIILFVISCNKSEKPNLSSQNQISSPPTNYEYIDSAVGKNYSTRAEIPYKTPIKYSFVVMHTKNQFTGDRGIYTTGVFETSEFISEDDKYKFMDEAQSNPRISTETVTKRELKSFDSYAEASKAREKILAN